MKIRSCLWRRNDVQGWRPTVIVADRQQMTRWTTISFTKYRVENKRLKYKKSNDHNHHCNFQWCLYYQPFLFFEYQIWQSFISSREPNTGKMIRSPIILGQKVVQSWCAFLNQKYSISQTLFLHMNQIIEKWWHFRTRGRLCCWCAWWTKPTANSSAPRMSPSSRNAFSEYSWNDFDRQNAFLEIIWVLGRWNVKIAVFIYRRRNIITKFWDRNRWIIGLERWKK